MVVDIRRGTWLLAVFLACAGAQERGNAADGSSCAHPVVIDDQGDGQAITQEYAFLAERYPGSHSASQALLTSCQGKPATLDQITVITAEGKTAVAFFELSTELASH
jgi:hypothetical protein